MEITNEERVEYLKNFLDKKIDIFALSRDDKCFYDVELMKVLVSEDLSYITLVKKEVFENDDFCKFLLDINIHQIYRLPKKWHDDKEIMLEVVKESGSYLYVASDRLRKDKDICEAAIKANFLAIEFVDESLITEDLIINLAEHFSVGSFYNLLPEKFKKNINVINNLIGHSPFIYSDMSLDLQKNEGIYLKIIECIKKSQGKVPYLDGCFPDELYESKTFRETIKKNFNFFPKINDTLKMYDKEESLRNKLNKQNNQNTYVKKRKNKI